jgi:hypothetical protein
MGVQSGRAAKEKMGGAQAARRAYRRVLKPFPITPQPVEKSELTVRTGLDTGTDTKN